MGLFVLGREREREGGGERVGVGMGSDIGRGGRSEVARW